MSERSLIFSVFGLTVRGFQYYDDKWVPEEGQRLSCALCSGSIHVFKDGELVGKVAKEVPNGFKRWIKENGTVEVVVTGSPKHHKTKGQEVPVVIVLRSKENCQMINRKRQITREIVKLKKKKKSLEIKDGDATEEMIFSVNNETQFDFSINGMTMRGFFVSSSFWVPEIGDRFLCSLSGSNSVEMLKDGKTIGNVQSEGQTLFRKFLNASGVIHAVVNGDPKPHRSKGEEIPMIYQFSADDWIKRLQNIRIEIRNDIKKRSKRKRSLKFICSNDESQNEAGSSGMSYETQSMDMAGRSGVNMFCTNAREQAGPSYETQSMDRTCTSGENKFSTKMKSSNKLLDDVEDVSAESIESHPENTENGEGEKISYGQKSSGQVKILPKRRADERAGGSVEKIPNTDKIQKIKKSAKNEHNLQTTEKLPDAEASRHTTQLPKKDKNTTAKHLLETKIVLKTETTKGTKKQPKTKKAQQSGSGKQRLKQKGGKVENEKRNKEDIKKRSKKKKCLQFICSEESQNETGPSCERQSMDMTGGSGENMVKKSLKRRADDMAGGSAEKIIKTEEVKDNKRSVKNKQDLQKAENQPKTESSKTTKQISRKEKVPKAGTEKDPKTKQFQEMTNKPKTMKVLLSSASANQKLKQEAKKECGQTAGAGLRQKHAANSTLTAYSEKVRLTDKHLMNFAKYIYGNWESLGVHLGLNNADIGHIKEDYPLKTRFQIYQMLLKWRQDNAEACLDDVQSAMENCSKEIFQQPELDNYIQAIKDEYKAEY